MTSEGARGRSDLLPGLFCCGCPVSSDNAGAPSPLARAEDCLDGEECLSGAPYFAILAGDGETACAEGDSWKRMLFTGVWGITDSSLDCGICCFAGDEEAAAAARTPVVGLGGSSS